MIGVDNYKGPWNNYMVLVGSAEIVLRSNHGIDAAVLRGNSEECVAGVFLGGRKKRSNFLFLCLEEDERYGYRGKDNWKNGRMVEILYLCLEEDEGHEDHGKDN